MTFKHVKFEDSPIMRSLEKVAQQKGLIKQEPLNKTATAKKPIVDLTPTESLMDNILKLCGGLRDRGFEKQAGELEYYLANYKKAQTLYETSPEKGEDLIEFAHPQGSHKLEGVEAENDGAVFEDILDQMAKTLEVVEKKPTGKLSSTQKAIQAVKVTLGATPLDLNELYGQAEDSFHKFKQIYSAIALKSGGKAGDNEQFFDSIQNYNLNKRKIDTSIKDDVLIDSLDNLKDDISPGWFSNVEEENKWQNELLPMFAIANRYAGQFKNFISKIRMIQNAALTESIKKEYDPEAVKETVSTPPTPNEADSLIQNYKTLVDNINRDIARVQARQLPNAQALIAWLNKAQNNFATKFMNEYSTSQYKNDSDIIKSYTDRYNSIKDKIDAFEKKWLS